MIVGVNKFQQKEPPPKGLLKVDPKVRELQVQRLAELKSSRDGQKVKTALEGLRRTAQGEGNLIGPILNCVRSYATLGEICDTLRGVFGEYEAPATV